MKTIKPTEPIQTRGNLDKVVIENDVLHLGGWVASVDAGPVEGFKIVCAGKELTDFVMALGLDSPDVEEMFPKLDCSEKARFHINVFLNEQQQEQVRDSLIVLTPLFEGREGCLLLDLLEPSLPLPDSDLRGFIGANVNFTDAAIEFLGYFLQKGGLKPTENVLDIGCGAGRMAYALAYYLAPTARYEGFDIAQPLIEWAGKNITARFPNFNFRQVNIYNKLYNPDGTLQATEFAFPYEDETFDFALLTSVFTHLPSEEVRHYLDEIVRVLKPGGRCLCTVLLHNEESQKLMEEGKSTANLVYQIDDYFATSPDVPERFIGFPEDLLLTWICDRGFTLQGKYYGDWCRRTEFTSHQDILVFQKDCSFLFRMQMFAKKIYRMFQSRNMNEKA
ncbi:class I SAM-dependent methyltransferase [Argonema antarcticum]|uniref:class I SAM-dependent methyltransferase n=1 Tax=Argonema antarcticum TaxID=2942763 RepID=UPI0020127EDB|nr:class I SAM-dependent methyltransferase [Argonema antarcticum]MCL1470957.1 class I SAM-dependent methyltransferase [Argonema antarcticum A004/B2]